MRRNNDLFPSNHNEGNFFFKILRNFASETITNNRYEENITGYNTITGSYVYDRGEEV